MPAPPAPEPDSLPTGTAPRPLSPAQATPPAGVSGATPDGAQSRFVPGALFAGRYRIVGLLGKGGMGEVYRADDLRLGQPVALKFLPEAVQDDSGRRERFYNEVRTARQVAHPAVCRVYDVAEADGQHFLSMEYVDGEDLSSLLRRIGRLPQDKALDIARQLCAGLAAAHERGVLHRDLKPENVMLDGRGKARITDFGLAALASTLSGDDVRSGTPAYMSPEQLAGREVTAASDVYSLGLVLYELFTGRKAFAGRTLAEITRQHREGTPTNPSQIVGEIDPAAEAVILRCLEKDPRLRPPSALAVAAALPGGDPLAAALAAGETPSPELVAASGQTEGLRPAVAWALLALVGLALVAAPLLARRMQLTGFVPLPRAPAALEDRAREILAGVAPGGEPTDEAVGFAVDADHLQYVNRQERSPDRWVRLASARPAVVRFWYRRSPRPLLSTSISGRVFSSNPPVVLAGMAGVELDPQGRLVSLYVVTPQLEGDETRAPAGPPDWEALFRHAQLDPAAFRPAAPRWTPPFHTDARAAWEPRAAGGAEVPLRVEAAAYRGRPVFFETVGGWTRPERQESYRWTPAQAASNRFGATLILSVLVLALLLARHNVRLGRGDRRGARRLSVYALVTCLVVFVLEAHHIAELGAGMTLALRGIGFALTVAAAVWVMYLAIEPYVRRRWPGTLVSWTRLLTGRFKDPVVGRDVMMGVAVGAALALLIPVGRVMVPTWLGYPPPPPVAEGLDAALGLRMALAWLLNAQVTTLASGMLIILLLLVLRLVLRREWLAASAFAGLLSLQPALTSDMPFWVMLPLAILLSGLPLYLVFRSGILPSLVALFVAEALLGVTVPPSLGHWSAEPFVLAAAVTVGLAAYGFRTSTAGRPLLRAELLG